MNLKILRQIFKACADDTRLRILSLLDTREFNVGEICFLLKIPQPTVSKHLTNLRLLKIVIDRRQGNLVYYGLNKDISSAQGKTVNFIISQFHNINIFKKDKQTIKSEKIKFKTKTIKRRC